MQKKLKEDNVDSSKYLFTRLFEEHIKPYRKKLLLAIFFMVIVAAANAVHAWMIKPILDEIFFKHDNTMLIVIPLIVILIAIVKAISSYYQNYLMKYIGQRIVTDVQARLYEHLIKSDIEFLGNSSSGKLISRFTNDISLLRTSISNFLTGIAKEFITVIFLFGVMLSLNLTLSIITFIIFPIAIFPIIKMGRKMRRISTSTQEELGNYTAKLDDTFQTIKIVKSYMREDFEVNKARNILERIFTLYVKAIKTESLSSPIIELISGIAIAIVVWYGGHEVMNGSTSPGGFFAFITAFIASYKPIKCLADLNNNLQEGLAATKRLFNVLDEKSKINDAADAKDLTVDGAKILFKNAQYNYAGGDTVIKGIDLSIDAGKTVAFVGGSGSGKSTILNLLLRFYNLKEGNIYIDGQDINKATLKSLRESISYVSQEVLLFDNTILSNIEYGLLGSTEDKIIKASEDADASEFINNFPNKFDTLVGQYGSKLSGGQKQRISIARAFLKNAPILILDEATSSLDNISERIIYNNLKKIRQNKTTIIVAHRLSTIIDADEIFVFKNGKVVEKGNHNSLLELKGEYSKLYTASLANET